jgi:hypothetical protein
MSFPVGYKVSFLNEKLDGIVAKVLNQSTVEVVTSDGFGIPTLNSELVLIEREGNKGGGEGIKAKSRDVSFSQRISLDKKLYLCYSKTNTEQLELFILNNTNERQFVTVRVRKQSKWTVIFSSEIGKSSYKFVDSYIASELDAFSEVIVNTINTEFSLVEIDPPKSARIKIKAVKFHKESSFVEVPVLEKNAMLVPVETTAVEEEQVKEEIKKHIESTEGKKIAGIKLQGLKILGKIDLSQSSKKNAANSDNEIDLHIEKISKKYVGKPNGEIVQVQLEATKEFLNKSMISGKKEITLIHGVGNGTLKTEIRKLLKGYYGIKFEDADFRKYGKGATLVYLKK